MDTEGTSGEVNVTCTCESKHSCYIWKFNSYTTSRCAGAIGIYFLLKRCQVVYLYANNGTFWQSPYLDVHGEVDISMRQVFFFLAIYLSYRP